MSEIKNCPFCGEEINVSATKCKHCGEWLDGQNHQETNLAKSELPTEYRKFNWGAFLLSWIWGIGNKTYIAFFIFATSLLNIIPFVGWVGSFAFAIYLGIKGNELAWKNNTWESIEQFNNVQQKWAMWGGIIIGSMIMLSLVLCIITIIAMSLGY